QPPEENRTIWVRSVGSDAAQKLAGTENPGGLLWSPDGSSIAFVADRKLKKVILATGSVQPICDLVGPVVGATWNRDGVILIGKGNVINRVPDTGGEITPVAPLDATRKETIHALP